MRIAFLGCGKVGAALADNLARAGHTVVLGSRDERSVSVRSALARNDALTSCPIREAVAKAQVVFLATPYTANASALDAAGDLAGKVLVDCTNPIGQGLRLLVPGESSGGEEVQRLRPAARVVKAFSIYGYENFEDSRYPGYGELRPAMLICGNDGEATSVVSRLAAELGWEPVVVGDITMSRYLEVMAMLWINMARVQGRGAGFTWAMLRRDR